MGIIKLNQADIEAIVQKAVQFEQYETGGSFDILGEEQPEDQPVADMSTPEKALSLMGGDDGNYYVVDWQDPTNPKIVAQTHK